MDKPLFKLITLKEAREFLDALPDKVREKVLYNIRKVRFGVQDKDLFKKLDGEIWEFRTSWQGMAYRLFAFWDNDGETLVIATHGLIKKTQKTPQREKDKAKAIRKEWFNNKNK
ncbi:MAG: type II toxin-antitoxin system RelE/ParE family toxin [Bacteroidales bacterium]|nr:type II toxin-antitoxin system RelE/ParE family toxin [Bacteroidales bacterium]